MATDLIIVGSSELWLTPEVIAIAVGKIVSSDPTVNIGVRIPRGSQGPTTPLERFVSDVGPDLDRRVIYYQAKTNVKGDVWRRDYDMVEHAVAVLAFFAPDREMEGGTGHVVQAALAREIAVEAYRLNDDGHPELMGSDEGARGDLFGNADSTSAFTFYPPKGKPIVYSGGVINTTASWDEIIKQQLFKPSPYGNLGGFPKPPDRSGETSP